MKRNKTIGLFISQMNDRYHSEIWPQVSNIAEQFGYKVLVFVGQSLKDPNNFNAQENVVYSLAGKENIDGLLITGSLCNYLSDDELRQFISLYRDIPFVSISRKIDKIPNVTADNYMGMFDLVSHMINKHNRKRIAFIRGQENNPEAEMRYLAYRNALKENRIKVDPDLVALGTFAGPTGMTATIELLDERKVNFDCLVAANDDMLLWAMKVLQERKIRIPEDVAIGGFDNLPETRFTEPPITTVEQPLGLLSKKATLVLIDLIEGRHVKELDHFVPASLVVRRSCGCGESTGFNQDILAFEIPEKIRSASVISELANAAGEIRAQVLKSVRFPENLVEELRPQVAKFVNSYFGNIEGNGNGVFENDLNEIMKTVTTKAMYEFWREVLYKFQNILAMYIGLNREFTLVSDQLFLHIHEMLAAQVSNVFNAENSKSWEDLWEIKRISQSLVATFELPKIAEALKREFPYTGINGCNITFFENTNISLKDLHALPSERSRLIFFYNNYQKVPDEMIDRVFNTRDLSPYDLFGDNQSVTWCIYPLYFENIHFGYICFEIRTFVRTFVLIHDLLKEHLSSAFKGAFLVQELKNTHKQLLEAAETAKEANFHKSKVLVNMSHELRTPLNSINGITSLLEVGGYEKTEEIALVLNELIRDMDRKKPLPKLLKDMKKELQSYLELLDSGADTTPFFFRYIRERIVESYGKKYNTILKSIDRIIGYMEEEDDETFKAYKYIKEAGIYLLGLIDMVLNLSKVETGKMDVFRTNVQVRNLIESTIVDSDNYAKSVKKDEMIRLEYEVAEDVPENCYMDKQKVKEVLLNLISNGIKYTAKGVVKTSVFMEWGFIKFAVTDEGFGIPEEERKKIFTEFGRTNDAKKIEGTGLGLVLSKKLVEMQGGQIGFTSEPGKGSTFWFTIPLMHKIQ